MDQGGQGKVGQACCKGWQVQIEFLNGGVQRECKPTHMRFALCIANMPSDLARKIESENNRVVDRCREDAPILVCYVACDAEGGKCAVIRGQTTMQYSI